MNDEILSEISNLNKSSSEGFLLKKDDKFGRLETFYQFSHCNIYNLKSQFLDSSMLKLSVKIETLPFIHFMKSRTNKVQTWLESFVC